MDVNRVCCHRLFREHCTFYNGVFVKDLSKLNRNMEDIIIVDVMHLLLNFRILQWPTFSSLKTLCHQLVGMMIWLVLSWSWWFQFSRHCPEWRMFDKWCIFSLERTKSSLLKQHRYLEEGNLVNDPIQSNTLTSSQNLLHRILHQRPSIKQPISLIKDKLAKD